MRWWLGAVLFALASTAAAQVKRVDTEAARCVRLDDPQPFQFHGRRLVEIPDVTDPAMRRANILFSSGCFEQAKSLVDAYVGAHGVTAESAYVVARGIWLYNSAEAAERYLEEARRTFPELTSLQVLSAGLLFDHSRDGSEVNAILDRVEPVARDDMWIYVYRLRVQALTAPSEDVKRTLLEILGDSRFPPNVRDIAAVQARRLPYPRPGDFDATYRGQLAYASATPLGCKLDSYAVWLMESESRFEDARRLLEQYLGSADPCSIKGGKPRMLLAYASLVAAADLEPRPGAANAQLVSRADGLLGGDYRELATWLQGRPQQARLRPFIDPHVAVNGTDKYDRTALCNAVLQRNIDAMRAELERGADANGSCSEVPIIRRISVDMLHKIPERQQMLRLLLGHGATPDVAACKDNVECREELLPIFREYGFGK